MSDTVQRKTIYNDCIQRLKADYNLNQQHYSNPIVLYALLQRLPFLPKMLVCLVCSYIESLQQKIERIRHDHIAIPNSRFDSFEQKLDERWKNADWNAMKDQFQAVTQPQNVDQFNLLFEFNRPSRFPLKKTVSLWKNVTDSFDIFQNLTMTTHDVSVLITSSVHDAFRQLTRDLFRCSFITPDTFALTCSLFVSADRERSVDHQFPLILRKNIQLNMLDEYDRNGCADSESANTTVLKPFRLGFFRSKEWLDRAHVHRQMPLARFLADVYAVLLDAERTGEIVCWTVGTTTTGQLGTGRYFTVCISESARFCGTHRSPAALNPFLFVIVFKHQPFFC